MRGVVLFLYLLALILSAPPAEIRGCAPVPRKGERIDVNAEEAIIVYDAVTQTEHFIRRTNFRTEAKDFGFLVPTPRRPELGEVKTQAFHSLQEATAPRHVPSGKVIRMNLKSKNQGQTPPPTNRAVAILESKTVAGYDAVVLQADDIAGLNKWLDDNHYDARPSVMEWLKWYVEHHWIITAFKVAHDGKAANQRWATSVRMSFATPAPFYPYREPEDMRTPDSKQTQPQSRQLRVYLLADARYRGTLGTSAAWAGQTIWSNLLPADVASQIVGNLGLVPTLSDNLKAKTWHLTEFEDNSSPRLGTEEVFFNRAEDQGTVERPVKYYDSYEYVYEDEQPADQNNTLPSSLMIIGGVLAAILLVGASLLVMLRRRRSTV